MATIREQVLANVQTVIAAGSTATVERNRDVAVATFPTVNQIDGGHVANYEHAHGLVLYTMAVTLELYVTATTDDALGTALNDLYGETLKLVLADRTRGGIALDTREIELGDPIRGEGEGRGPTMAAPLELEIDFWTDPSDPEVVAPF